MAATSQALMKNIGAFITSRNAQVVTDVTAGGTGDATEIDGQAIDRLTVGDAPPCQSAKLVIGFEAVLAAAATLSIAANAQHTDDDGSGAPVTGSYADLTEVLANAVVATGPGGGGTVRGTVELDIDLSRAKQWIRSQVTPNLSAANTDTCEVYACWIFGGGQVVPIES